MSKSTEGSSTAILRPDAGAVHRLVLEAMASPAVPAGSPEFEARIDTARRLAGELLGAGDRPLLATGSGTRQIETALTQMLPWQGDVVVARNGYFGARLETIARLHRGSQVVAAESELGKSLEPAALGRLLEERESVAAVLLTHTETSSGVLNPIEDLARVVRQKAPRALIFVDAIGSFGAEEICFDDWGIDALAVTFHKVISAPAGLSALALSQRAWRAIEEADVRIYADDLRRLRDRQTNGHWPHGPPVHLLQGVGRALDLIFEEGVERFRARLACAGRVLREALSAAGFKMVPSAADASSSITVMRLPPGLNAGPLVERLRKGRVEILQGRGEIADETIRLSHFGQQSVEGAAAVARRIVAITDELRAEAASRAATFPPPAGVTIEDLRLELLPVDQVVPHERQHRGHGSGLDQQMRADGCITTPIIVQEGRDGRYPLDDGTHRLWMAKRLGLECVPAQVVADADLEVRGWSHLVRAPDDGILLDELAAAGLELQRLSVQDAEEGLRTRALLAWFALAGEADCVGILWPRAGLTEALCRIVDVYGGETPQRLVAERFERDGQIDPGAVFARHPEANLFVRFASFTPAHVRAFAEEPIPAGITRIVVRSARLLGVDAPLAVLAPDARPEDRLAWLEGVRARPSMKHRGPVSVAEFQGDRVYEEDVVSLDPELRTNKL